MRLYIPNKVQETEDGEFVHNAEKLKEEINKLTNSGLLGESIAVIPGIQMITPRGKISVHMLKETFKITGPSHDYKIPYSNISRAFMLPRQDGIHLSFVIGLTTPMRQGATSYPFIVFQFKKDEEADVELKLPDEDKERSAILKHPIDLNLSGATYDIMAKLFKSIIGIGIIIPGKFKR